MSQPDEKQVLVGYFDHNRIVRFATRDQLVPSIKATFNEVIPPNEIPNICIQIKSEDWGGIFIDLAPEDDVPDRSVLRVIITGHSSNVCKCTVATCNTVY